MEDNVYERYADLISSIDTISKNKKGFGYTYLELVKLFDEVLPKIREHGFVLAQSVRQTSQQMTRSIERPFTIKVDKETQITDRNETITFNAPVYDLHSELIDIQSKTCILSCDMPLYTDDLDPQAIGSAETYMRRYSVFAMLGIKTEDDDGFGASPKAKTKNFKDLNTVEEFAEAIKDASLTQLKAMYWHWKDKPFAAQVKKLSDARKLQLENPDLDVKQPTVEEDSIPDFNTNGQ